jgi:hypothetical protein
MIIDTIFITPLCFGNSYNYLLLFIITGLFTFTVIYRYQKIILCDMYLHTFHEFRTGYLLFTFQIITFNILPFCVSGTARHHLLVH